MVLKTLDINKLDSHSWEVENKWNEPSEYPVIVPRESTEAMEQGRNRLQSLVVTLSWTGEAGNPGMPRQLKFSGQSTREERAAHRKNSGDLQEFPL